MGRPVSAEQLPTLPGKVDGIIGLDPLVLQCRSCGVTYTGTRRRIAVDVILSGFHFHGCEKGGGRKCPDCLAAAEAACPNRGRHA